MPVKKAQKPSGSIRYLLFADRSLRKISLKKISERVKKTKPAARSARAKKPASRKPAAPPSMVSGRAIAVAVGVVVVAAVMLAARQPSAPSAPSTDTMVGAAPESAIAIAAPDTPIVAEPAQPPKRTEKKPAVSIQAKPAAARTPALNVTPRREPEFETVKVTAVERVKPASAPPVKPPPPESAPPEANAAKETLTTVTGCVAAGDGTFWLKNASGADVPKSRSWKSGFFRKRSARIEVLDATHALSLANYVGQRVAATGTLEDRELRARSVRRLATSCD